MAHPRPGPEMISQEILLQKSQATSLHLLIKDAGVRVCVCVCLFVCRYATDLTPKTVKNLTKFLNDSDSRVQHKLF